MDVSNWPWTTIIAVYAAFVATASLLWKVYTDLLDRPHVKVEASIDSSPFDGFHIRGLTPEALIQNYPAAKNKPFYVGVTAVNKGRRPIIVVAGGLYVSDRTATPVIDFLLPPRLAAKKLDEGDVWSVYTDLKGFSSTLESAGFCGGEVKAWVSDVTGRKYWGRVPDKTRNALLES